MIAVTANDTVQRRHLTTASNRQTAAATSTPTRPSPTPQTPTLGCEKLHLYLEQCRRGIDRHRQHHRCGAARDRKFPLSAGFTVRPRASGATTVAEFDAAYAAAQPGDHVVAANGLSIPARTLARSGTTANPIVIRAANNQQASFTGELTVTGKQPVCCGGSRPRQLRFRHRKCPCALPCVG